MGWQERFIRARRNRQKSEAELTLQQMMQTVLIEDVPPVGSGATATPPTPPSPASPIVGQGQVGQAQIP